MFGARCWMAIAIFIQNPTWSPISTKHCRWTGTAYHRNQSTESSVESFTLWLKTCTKADGEQTENTKWLSSVHCVVSVTLFCCVSAQTFFSAWKSLSSRAKISITNIYFTQKFQMVAEKTANDFRGFLFHLLYTCIPLQVYALMATKHDYNTEHETVFCKIA